MRRPAREEIRQALATYVLVRLYTDGSGEVFERQQHLQQTKNAASPAKAAQQDDFNEE